MRPAGASSPVANHRHTEEEGRDACTGEQRLKAGR